MEIADMDVTQNIVLPIVLDIVDTIENQYFNDGKVNIDSNGEQCDNFYEISDVDVTPLTIMSSTLEVIGNVDITEEAAIRSNLQCNSHDGTEISLAEDDVSDCYTTAETIVRSESFESFNCDNSDLDVFHETSKCSAHVEISDTVVNKQGPEFINHIDIDDVITESLLSKKNVERCAICKVKIKGRKRLH